MGPVAEWRWQSKELVNFSIDQQTLLSVKDKKRTLELSWRTYGILSKGFTFMLLESQKQRENIGAEKKMWRDKVWEVHNFGERYMYRFKELNKIGLTWRKPHLPCNQIAENQRWKNILKAEILDCGNLPKRNENTFIQKPMLLLLLSHFSRVRLCATP